MKTTVIAFLSALFMFVNVNAQDHSTDTIAQKEIKMLDFMIGKWTGQGWMTGADREKHNFDQTEDIRYKVDGTTILVEGIGRSEGKVMHNAMGVISWDKDKAHYNFRAYLANGKSGDFKAELLDGKFHWYPAENIRYIMSINEKGQWYQIGEMNRAGNWHPFFEMTLKKVKM